MTRLLSLLACVAAGAMATMSGESIIGGQSYQAPSGMSSGSDETVIVSVNVIGWTMGGSSGWVQQNQPSKSTGMNHQVIVGGSNGLVFSPCTINAAVGDMVTFSFMSQNHTLTQSAFAFPCVKMAGAIDSSFMPNINNTVNPPPVFQMQVMTLDPTWFYCKQKTHCGKGMTFSINPSAAKTAAAFHAAAIAQNSTAAAGSPQAVAPPSSPPPAAASAASAPAAAAATPGNSIIAGSGDQSNGVCSCSCLCGATSFPPMAGIGAFGGMSGSMPMS